MVGAGNIVCQHRKGISSERENSCLTAAELCPCSLIAHVLYLCVFDLIRASAHFLHFSTPILQSSQNHSIAGIGTHLGRSSSLVLGDVPSSFEYL